MISPLHSGIPVLFGVLVAAALAQADDVPDGDSTPTTDGGAESALILSFANQSDMYLVRLQIRDLARKFDQAADSLNVDAAMAAADSMRALAHRFALRGSQLAGVPYPSLLRWLERDTAVPSHFFPDHALSLVGTPLLGLPGAQAGTTGVRLALPSARSPSGTEEEEDASDGLVDKLVRHTPTVVTWALGVWATYETTRALRD